MSKKDYVAMAKILGAAIDRNPDVGNSVWFGNVVRDIERMFGSDNSRFDTGKFHQAVYGKGNK